MLDWIHIVMYAAVCCNVASCCYCMWEAAKLRKTNKQLKGIQAELHTVSNRLQGVLLKEESR